MFICIYVFQTVVASSVENSLNVLIEFSEITKGQAVACEFRLQILSSIRNLSSLLLLIVFSLLVTHSTYHLL